MMNGKIWKITLTFAVTCHEFDISGADLLSLSLAEVDVFEEQCPDVVAETVRTQVTFESVTGFDARC